MTTSTTSESSSSSSNAAASKANTNTNNNSKRQPINQYWTYWTEDIFHRGIQTAIVSLSTRAARYPKTCVISITVLSFALIITGFFTHFQIIYNHEEFFTPIGSLPEQHAQWIRNREQSGFEQTRPLFLVLHREGQNVVSAQNMRHLFLAVDTVLETDGYSNVCSTSSYTNTKGQSTCKLSSATQFWNHNLPELEAALSNFVIDSEEQDAYIQQHMSNQTFPDGTPVFHEAILGNYQMLNQSSGEIVTVQDTMAITKGKSPLELFSMTTLSTEEDDDDNNNNTISNNSQQQPELLLQSAQSYIVKIDIPNLETTTDELEERILKRLAALRNDFSNTTTSSIQLEYFTMYAYQLEFEQAIYSDIPLVVVMMTIMIGFCCLVFYDRHDRVQSRSLMGFFSIATIGMSLMTGYGIVWIIGVPFTNIAMMVPFIVVGIGLDDTFIITGAYFRTREDTIDSTDTSSNEQQQQQQQQQQHLDQEQVIQRRIQQTMEEVGLSISLTTTTTIVAFALGSISSIPAIRWLCIYGCVTIGVDFIYQITYFVAWLVLDERRVQANRKDCCIWITVQGEDDDGGGSGSQEDNDSDEPKDSASARRRTQENNTNTNKPPFSVRFMSWYADQLLKPATKVVVLLAFTAYLGFCVYCTTQMTQEFRVPDYVPEGSHVESFFRTFEDYSTLFRQIGVYFRHVDQSDVQVQQQMIDYVDQLSELEQIGGPPEFFWVRDFAEMATSSIAQDMGLNLENKTFEEQIDLALQIPQVQDGYGNDIVRDPTTGEITASRCFIFLRKIDMDSVPNQIDMLLDQRAISARQPVNQENDKGWSFFTFDDLYFFWELYAVSVDELIFTTITGVCAVSTVAFLFIPHWSAIGFVTPLIICLYFLLLGTMQYCGIHINAVTYVIIVMAIGLLVDFLMHIMLRYYETTGRTRDIKVKETLVTMGSSILLGGLTTFLGIVPLAFSSTKIFMTVFVSFLAMVSIGCGVGLIVLPVVLSLLGPVATTSHDARLANNASSSSKEVNSSLDETREQSSDMSLDEADASPTAISNSRGYHNDLVMSASQEDGYETVMEV